MTYRSDKNFPPEETVLRFIELSEQAKYVNGELNELKEQFREFLTRNTKSEVNLYGKLKVIIGEDSSKEDIDTKKLKKDAPELFYQLMESYGVVKKRKGALRFNILEED